MTHDTRRRMLQVTQRLDHMVPDNMLPTEKNAEISQRLEELSEMLIKHVPDPSLSPDERLERIARVDQRRVPQREYLLPAVEKLYRLERRLDDLVDDSDLSSTEQLEVLIERVEERGEKHEERDFVEILERMGDERAGLDPIRETPREAVDRDR